QRSDQINPPTDPSPETQTPQSPARIAASVFILSLLSSGDQHFTPKNAYAELGRQQRVKEEERKSEEIPELTLIDLVIPLI
ncbi:hypothetical protein Ancab_034519, partial [Ancistrocladus abbreviatus]